VDRMDLLLNCSRIGDQPIEGNQGRYSLSCGRREAVQTALKKRPATALRRVTNCLIGFLIKGTAVPGPLTSYPLLTTIITTMRARHCRGGKTRTARKLVAGKRSELADKTDVLLTGSGADESKGKRSQTCAPLSAPPHRRSAGQQSGARPVIHLAFIHKVPKLPTAPSWQRGM
jgi:hypothetical protein